MNLKELDMKKLKDKYINNLHRLNKAENYFKSLSDYDYKNMENSKPYLVFVQLLNETNEIHYQFKELGIELPTTLEEIND